MGILCPPDDWYIEDTQRAISSITNQIGTQNVIKTFIVFIGILSTNPNEIARTKQRLNKLQEANVRYSYISLTEDEVQARLRSHDIQPALYAASRDIIEQRTRVNMLLSSVMWHGNQVGKYFLITDLEILMKPGALPVFIQEFERNGGGRKLLRLKGAGKTNSFLGMLYSKGRPLESFAEFLYWLSPYGDLSNFILHFEHLHRSHFKAVSSSEIFVPQELREDVGLAVEKNPPAMITTNMKVAHEIHLPTNPYERGEFFWTTKPIKGSFITIKFMEPQRIKSIRIETGINIYLVDMITRAVLEEATNIQGINCGDFKQIADFRSGRVSLNFTNSLASASGERSRRRSETRCLRIRMIEDEGHWAGIRLIQVIT